MRNGFVVNILHKQNSTWQGSVTWLETNETQYFRSALELIMLIDSAVSPEESDNDLRKFSAEDKKD